MLYVVVLLYVLVWFSIEPEDNPLSSVMIGLFNKGVTSKKFMLEKGLRICIL